MTAGGSARRDTVPPRTMSASRMPLEDQISQGRLVCPASGESLTVEGDHLVSARGTQYHLHDGVPLLLQDVEQAREYVARSGRMVAEYESAAPDAQAPGLLARLAGRAQAVLTRGGIDYRTERSEEAFREIFDAVEPGSLCISIGGGPLREHPSFVNVNIGPFPNVDVVADAHHLPYADASVDAIFCEAVLEHLARPHEAVKEMFRVLRSGGWVYANTPFMQAYHGYPNHFQNFTLSGHQQLFANAGFHLRDSGTAVGPLFTLFDLGGRFISEYSPRPIRPVLQVTLLALRYLLLPLSRRLTDRQNAYVLASTTYVVAQRP
jgi:Methyltransferase domain